jgi:hypothetical protein
MKAMDPGVRRWRPRRGGGLLHHLLLMATAAAGFSACGNVTSGGVGEVELLLSSDEWELEATESGLGIAGLGGAIQGWGSQARGNEGWGHQGKGSQVVVDEEELAGTLSVSVRSYVRAGGPGTDDWVEITDGVQEIVVPLEDPTPVVIARATLNEGEYRAIRTLFGRVRVEVERGLTIGGEPFTGEIRVTFGESGLLLVEERNLRIEPNRSIPLLLEMGTRRWIHLADQETRDVSESDFEREFRTRTGSAR